MIETNLSKQQEGVLFYEKNDINYIVFFLPFFISNNL